MQSAISRSSKYGFVKNQRIATAAATQTTVTATTRRTVRPSKRSAKRSKPGSLRHSAPYDTRRAPRSATTWIVKCASGAWLTESWFTVTVGVRECSARAWLSTVGSASIAPAAARNHAETMKVTSEATESLLGTSANLNGLILISLVLCRAAGASPPFHIAAWSEH